MGPIRLPQYILNIQKAMRVLCIPFRSLNRSLRVLVILSITIVLILVLQGHLDFDDDDPSATLFMHRENTTDECGIWPDTSGVTMNRTLNQFRCFESYARRTTGTVRSTKSILIVGEFYFDFGEAQRAFVEDKCPISECTMTLDADRYRRTVDAIVILNMDAKKLASFLPKPAHQIWIANHWESPEHNRIDTVAIGNYINWSSSYRHDSHIVTPYGHVERRALVSDIRHSPLIYSTPIVTNYAAGKTKQVAWFASNCNDKNGRRNYANELGRYIGLDIYGKCGTLNCPRSNSQQCFDSLKNDYKFYLSFENSNCLYYMTEKLFHSALRHNVIPIVMGARPEDYAASLPPHSYIHVDDFRSPSHLADYLHVLDKNDTLYNEYFRWKSDWVLANHSYWCRLCGLLHVASEQNYVHWYPDYSHWWDGYRGNACGSRWTSSYFVWWKTWLN